MAKKYSGVETAKVDQKKNNPPKEAFGPKRTKIFESNEKVTRESYEKDTGVFNQ